MITSFINVINVVRICKIYWLIFTLYMYSWHYIYKAMEKNKIPINNPDS